MLEYKIIISQQDGNSIVITCDEISIYISVSKTISAIGDENGYGIN